MLVIVDNQLTIKEATKEEIDEIKKDLTVRNPKYIQNGYLGYSRRGIPQNIYFYVKSGKDLIVPFGYIRILYSKFKNVQIENKIHTSNKLDIRNNIELYDYQEQAALETLKKKHGIIVMPAGSGKTQTALKIACYIGHKTLWITHTLDLLNQSYDRAKNNGIDGLGKIASGKVNIGENITFATVQTLSKVNLNSLKDEFGTIIVDECHKICGSPSQCTMFYKCISSLSSRYKIGLTATPDKKNKELEKAMYMLLGEVVSEVDRSVVNKLHAKIHVVNTGYALGEEAEKPDGTIDYNKASYILGQNEERNNIILKYLRMNKDHYNLILGDRVENLTTLRDMLGEGIVIHGKTKKTDRENGLEALREGKENYLFATYALASTGLDIQRLDRLFLVSPKDGKADIIQSVGRIERVFKGKDIPIVYDFLDDGDYFIKKFKKRKRFYKINGNYFD